MTPRRVAVIGAGVMGHGIAELYALAGMEVALVDTSDAALAAARRGVEASLAQLVEEGLVTREAAAGAAGRLAPTTSLDRGVSGAELVTEAVPEVLALKHELLDRLESLIDPAALIASNSSTFPPTQLAERARHPERVVVTHFFNPAQLVPLVEVLVHPSAAAGTAVQVQELMRHLGKRPVLLRKEVPGFVANRLQAALAREAFHLLEEGVVDARDLDAVVTEGPGSRWPFVGPLETADLGGLDTWQHVLDNLAPVLSGARAAPALVAERVRQGQLGAKTGRGLYVYGPGEVERRLRQRDHLLAALLVLKRSAGGERG